MNAKDGVLCKAADDKEVKDNVKAAEQKFKS
jgi:hypothetical protein